jgi:hypothetical protein
MKEIEKHIVSFKLSLLNNVMYPVIKTIVNYGFNKTGNKFYVAINGSKGYVSNMEISCEGYQNANNRIFLDDLETKTGKLKSVVVNVFHSETNGVRLSIGKDKPEVILIDEHQKAPLQIADDELPF